MGENINLGSMQPQETFLIDNDGRRAEVVRFPLRAEFIIDPVSNEPMASRRHHGEEFQPIETK